MDETDLGRVSVEMPCRVTFDAFSGHVWNGKVIKIYPQGSQERGARPWLRAQAQGADCGIL